MSDREFSINGRWSLRLPCRRYSSGSPAPAMGSCPRADVKEAKRRMDAFASIRLLKRVKRKALDGFLQFLGGAEGDLLARLDLDRFAGRGIAAHARGALAHLQDAQSVEA